MIHENSTHYANSLREAPKIGITDIFEYVKKFMRTNKNLPCLLSFYKQTDQ